MRNNITIFFILLTLQTFAQDSHTNKANSKKKFMIAFEKLSVSVNKYAIDSADGKFIVFFNYDPIAGKYIGYMTNGLSKTNLSFESTEEWREGAESIYLINGIMKFEGVWHPCEVILIIDNERGINTLVQYRIHLKDSIYKLFYSKGVDLSYKFNTDYDRH